MRLHPRRHPHQHRHHRALFRRHGLHIFNFLYAVYVHRTAVFRRHGKLRIQFHIAVQGNALARHAAFQRHFQFTRRYHVQVQPGLPGQFVNGLGAQRFAGVKHLIRIKTLRHGLPAFQHLLFHHRAVHHIQRRAIGFGQHHRVAPAKHQMPLCVDKIPAFRHVYHTFFIGFNA